MQVRDLILQAYFGIIMALGMQLYRQDLYFKNCKPAMTQSRKRGSKIHGEGNAIIRKVKQFAVDLLPTDLGVSPRFAVAA